MLGDPEQDAVEVVEVGAGQFGVDTAVQADRTGLLWSHFVGLLRTALPGEIQGLNFEVMVLEGRHAGLPQLQLLLSGRIDSPPPFLAPAEHQDDDYRQ